MLTSEERSESEALDSTVAQPPVETQAVYQHVYKPLGSLDVYSSRGKRGLDEVVNVARLQHIIESVLMLPMGTHSRRGSECAMKHASMQQCSSRRKHRANDAKCAELGWVSIPFAVETYGRCWGTEAKWALSQLASLLATRQNCPKSTATVALYGKLSLTLVRVNIRAILSRTILGFI